MLRALIAEPDDFDEVALDTLREVLSVELRRMAPEDLAEAFAEYDVVWLRLAHRVERRHLEGARCRILACAVTGLDHIDLQACAELGVQVVSLRGEVAFLERVRATAELTVGLALALMRHIPAASSSVAHGRWDRDAFRGTELFERRAGIVGVGRLGRIVAGYLRAFGMEVYGFDPRPDYPTDCAAERLTSLEELLAECDLVTVHVSYGPSTHGLLGRDALARMRPGAVLVNTSRGGVVDEAALLDALERGHLAGAALDVVTGEPHVGGEHPLVRYAREHDNLLLTPHIGGNTRESFEKTERFLAGRVVEAVRRLD